jgi:hypothetical protein
MIFNYHNHIVRDLAWAIASPPLLHPGQTACRWYSDDWYKDLYTTSESWLKQLDKSPDVLQERLDSQKDRRLGRYFETLWAFWLENNPRFDVIAHNLPLREAGRTLGELDFLVHDKSSGQNLHWEVAVKFYLGVGDTRLHCNWHGPGKKDRLDRKVEHLCNRQSVIYQRPEVQEMITAMGYRVDTCGVILKGRLFYPHAHDEEASVPVDANPCHLRSYWLTLSELCSQNIPVNSYSPLVGYGWMASAGEDDKIPWMSLDELITAIKLGDLRLPLYVSSRQPERGSKRFFVVPDDWSGGARQVA